MSMLADTEHFNTHFPQQTAIICNVSFLNPVADLDEQVIPESQPCSWILQRCKDLGTQYVQKFDAHSNAISPVRKVSEALLREEVLPDGHFFRPVFLKHRVVLQALIEPCKMNISKLGLRPDLKEIWLRKERDMQYRRKVSIDAIRFLQLAPDEYLEVLRKCLESVDNDAWSPISTCIVMFHFGI